LKIQIGVGDVIRIVDAGYFLSQRRGLRGLGESSPAQLGQIPASLFTQHCAQNVHSKLQIIASAESAGKSIPQHSQLGLSCNMNISLELFCLSGQFSSRRDGYE
jgi:hypothetical protein